jgi:hypothetical protein
VDSEPDSLFDHGSNIPLPFEPIFTRGLAKDPDGRYTTGDEFANDLRAVVDGLRQNSSPGFSKFPLPSLRAPVAAAPTDVPILNPVDAVDPGEARLPRFLRVLSTFDSAMQEGDLRRAERAFGDLRTIADDDGRFAESLKVCQEKILGLKHETTLAKTLSPEAAPSTLAQTSADERSSPKQSDSLTSFIRRAVSATEAERPELLSESRSDPESPGIACSACGARNRNDASFCIECGNSILKPPIESALPHSSNPAPSSQKTRSSTPKSNPSATWLKIFSLGSGAVRAAAHGARTLSLKFAERVPGKFDRRSRNIALAALAFCTILVICLVAFIPRRVPMEPHIGTAVIQTRGARLLKSTNASGPSIASLPLGTTIDILAVPVSGARRFWLVQPIVRGKALSKGYIEGTAFGNLTFSSPDAALSWARLLSASEGEPGNDLESEANAFQTVVARFPDTPQAQSATMEEAGLYLHLSKQKKIEGSPDDIWRSYAEKATALATKLPSDPQAADIVREVNEMLAATKPQPPAPDPAASGEAEDARDFARAERLKTIYDYDGAIEALNRILKRHPNNSKALELLSEAQQARDLEQGKLQ